MIEKLLKIVQEGPTTYCWSIDKWKSTNFKQKKLGCVQTTIYDMLIYMLLRE